MDKSPDAFRTISEVAEHLDTPAHVLRFWESRFPQIRPVKRAGGRRYYRPADMALLSGIKKLLHEDGLTIRGVQKILREQGVRHVAGLGGMGAVAAPEADVEAVLAAEFGSSADAVTDDMPDPGEVQTAQVISLEAALARQAAVAEPPAPQIFEDAPEAPFVEAEEEPLPDPVPFAPPAGAGATVEQPQAPEDPTAQDQGADDSEQTVETFGETTAAMRLRRADPAELAASRAELVAIRARLMDLRGRLAAGVRRRAR